MELRPEVQRFAELMEAVLRVNDGKHGWKNIDFRTLYGRAMQEMVEVHEAFAEVNYKFTDSSTQAENRMKVAIECADVANFMMMIMDNEGGDDVVAAFAAWMYADGQHS